MLLKRGMGNGEWGISSQVLKNEKGRSSPPFAANHRQIPFFGAKRFQEL